MKNLYFLFFVVLFTFSFSLSLTQTPEEKEVLDAYRKTITELKSFTVKFVSEFRLNNKVQITSKGSYTYHDGMYAITGSDMAHSFYDKQQLWIVIIELQSITRMEPDENIFNRPPMAFYRPHDTIRYVERAQELDHIEILQGPDKLADIWIDINSHLPVKGILFGEEINGVKTSYHYQLEPPEESKKSDRNDFTPHTGKGDDYEGFSIN